jgi:hypothetical protein
MKYNLTPELAYIIGLWKSRRTSEGIGIHGSTEICELFLRECLKLKIAAPDRVKFTQADREARMDGKVYFYHTALRAFFDEIVDGELERFKYVNDYSANFIAGMFDGVGGMSHDGKYPYFEYGTKHDEAVLLRLGFRVKREKKRIIVLEKEKFLRFVKPKLKFLGI